MTRAKPLSRRDFLVGTAAASGAALASSLLGPAASTGGARADAAGNREAWQIGCYTRPWAKYDYRTAMDAIAEAGFRYLGLMTIHAKSNLVISVQSTLEEAAQVGQEAKQRGLRIPSVYGGGIDTASRPAAVADLRHLIDLCAPRGRKRSSWVGSARRRSPRSISRLSPTAATMPRKNAWD